MISKTCENHLRQAWKNERLVLFLRNNCSSKKFYHWIFVVIFYSALHFFHAFLENRGDSIPDKHKSKNDNDLGGIDIAKNKFVTMKNNIMQGVGADYEQLFNWSCTARYNPTASQLLGNKELEVALENLERIKVVAFNEIEHRPDSEGKIKKVSEDYLKKMQEKYGQDINI